MDMLVTCHKRKQFSQFWNITNKFKQMSGVPLSFVDVTEHKGNANDFLDHF